MHFCWLPGVDACENPRLALCNRPPGSGFPDPNRSPAPCYGAPLESAGGAFGAGVGAGVGAISGAAAKGKSLYVPPETRLMFELRAPLPLG